MDEERRLYIRFFWLRIFFFFVFYCYLYHAYNKVCTVYFYNLQFGWRCRVLAPLICLLYCEYCAVLCCVYYFSAMFGFTMSSVRLILSVNGCKSIQKLLISYVLVCVSKWRCLNYTCIVRVQFSLSLCLYAYVHACIVIFCVRIWLFQRLYAKYKFNSVGCHFCAHTRTLMKTPLQILYFLQLNIPHFSMCTLLFSTNSCRLVLSILNANGKYKTTTANWSDVPNSCQCQRIMFRFISVFFSLFRKCV